MSISAEKLSELLSFYQRMSAYTLASPATLHGCMMARPIGGTVSNAFILPRSVAYAQPLSISCVSAANTSANASGNATTNVSASSKEQTQTVAATTSVVVSRQSSGTERRDLPSTTTSQDADQVEVQMLVFEGENIPAFDIGGERRLFMPMLLRRLLQRGFNDCAIRTACEELKIHLQEASNEQVDALRRALHFDVPRCGLIKRSDAERLWSLLEESNPSEKQPDADLKFSPAPSSEQLASHAPSTCSPVSSESGTERFGDLPTANSFKVYHACFGKQKGVFVPEWYSAPDARCIVCVRCGVHCSPERFVTHVHRATAENNVAHWGFDPAKWRAYLLLAKDQRTSKELRDYFESLKCKFDASRKRKVCSVALAHAHCTMQYSTGLALLLLLATCASANGQKPGEKVAGDLLSVELELEEDESPSPSPSSSLSPSPTTNSASEQSSTIPSQKDCEACCARERLAWLITIIVGSIGAFLLVVVLVLLNVIMCRKNIFVPDKLLVPVTIPISEPPVSKKSVMPIASQAQYVASAAAMKSNATTSSSL